MKYQCDICNCLIYVDTSDERICEKCYEETKFREARAKVNKRMADVIRLTENNQYEMELT